MEILEEIIEPDALDLSSEEELALSKFMNKVAAKRVVSAVMKKIHQDQKQIAGVIESEELASF